MNIFFCFFRPAGWDNQKKISILYENMHSCRAEDLYNDIIAQPPSRKTVSNRENEVQTEDEQAFLARQLQILQQSQQGQQGQQRSTSPMRTPQPGVKSSPRTPSSQGSPNKKVCLPKIYKVLIINGNFSSLDRFKTQPLNAFR